MEAFTRHADHVAIEAGSANSRRDQLTRRLAAIRARIEDLQDERAGPGETITNDQLAAARNQVTLSLAAAEQAVAASVSALRRAADAHDRTAELYERAAVTGSGDPEARRQQAISHRAAATADRQRASQIESMNPGYKP